MSGKTCLVTGGTSGIGEITARELARKGAKVVIIGRSTQKCVGTVQKIVAETGNESISFLIADLSSIRSIRSVAKEFISNHDRLDVLINNAGAYFSSRHLSEDGYELTLATNHNNYFLLTNLLLEKLESTAAKNGGGRIINVSSDAHRSGRIDFRNLQSERFYNGWKAYSQSKLANIIFSFELARRLKNKRITVNCLHPGFVATGFAKNNGFLYHLAMRVAGLFAISVEEGAKTSVYLASAAEVENQSGLYFVGTEATQAAKAAYNQDTAIKLWDISERMVGIAT
jgi:NAD(P)-dependent dehydrogenase (short-subunit alcohol dehydrogenase family)